MTAISVTLAATADAGFLARMRRRAPLLPALVFTVIVTQLPFLYSLYISTVSWYRDHPEIPHRFVGLRNFGTVFSDPRLRSSVLTTVELTTFVVVAAVMLGLVLALLLDRKFPGRGVARTLLIAPFLIMPMAAALLFKHAFYNAQFGLLNAMINGVRGWFGVHSPTQWSILSTHPLVAVGLPLIWQWTPFMMLILLSGLQSQPEDTLEAARVDGASAPQIFWFLTLPHLRQYLELAILLGTIYIVQAFDAIFTITQGISNTTNLPFAIFETQTESGDYGVTSAAGVIVVFGTIIIATFVLRVVSSLFKEQTR